MTHNASKYYRTVITFDNAGVGFSSGEVPDNVAAMAQYALDFLDALQLRQVDLLGFSLGGYIAQHLALHHPQLVRRLILAGTGPGKGVGRKSWIENLLSEPSAQKRWAEGLPFMMLVTSCRRTKVKK